MELNYWKGSEGNFMEVPSELEPLVEKLRKAATMTNEEARRISKENAIAITETMEKLGLS